MISFILNKLRKKNKYTESLFHPHSYDSGFAKITVILADGLTHVENVYTTPVMVKEKLIIQNPLDYEIDQWFTRANLRGIHIDKPNSVGVHITYDAATYIPMSSVKQITVERHWDKYPMQDIKITHYDEMDNEQYPERVSGLREVS